MSPHETKLYVSTQSKVVATKIVYNITRFLTGVIVLLFLALLGTLIYMAPAINKDECFVIYGLTPDSKVKATDSKTCAYQISGPKFRALGALELNEVIKKGSALESGSWYDDENAPKLDQSN